MAEVYITAKLRASDNYLGWGARWAYYDYANAFKIAAVPEEHAAWLEGRQRSGLDLFGTARAEMLPTAVREAAELADSYKARGGM